MDELADLSDLDLQVVTVTCDANGIVAVDGGDAPIQTVVFMLASAQHILLHGHFWPEDDEEGEDDDWDHPLGP